jgi:RimJ/RimL family protein N-acetyltransferase
MPELRFKALAAEDLAQMCEWLGRPHVSRWWGDPPTLEAVRDQYEPLILGADPTRCYIALLDERPVGMVQTYSYQDNLSEAQEIGAEPTDAGLDYFIGEPELTGIGLGPLILGRFLEDIVFTDPSVSGVRTTIDHRNRRSWRCLEKLGFTVGPLVPRHGGEVDYIPYLPRPQRSAAGQTSR